MKKFARLLAVVLAGVLLLSMTACSSASTVVDFDEETARQAIRDEINTYRKENNSDPCLEYKELDEFASACVKSFEEKKAVVLKRKDVDFDAYTQIADEVEDRWIVGSSESVGLDYTKGESGDGYYSLTCEYGSRDMLKAQIRTTHEITDSVLDSIGIGFVNVNGKVYWYAELCQSRTCS